MDKKEKYIKFCAEEKSLPLFFQPWWLDCVCVDGEWEALIYEKNEEILGVYPYYRKKKYGILNLISMPVFTPFLGPYLIYPQNLRHFEKASLEKEIYSAFIDKLPEFDYLIQCFNYSFTNWLPFLWNDFKQTTYYSYVIDDISDIEKVKSNFHYSKVKQINKAQKSVEVRFDMLPDDFYDFHRRTLLRQNGKISYDLELFRKLANTAINNNSGKIIYACNNDRICSALFFVWDENSGYNLISANDPETRGSGSLDLLVMNAIAFLSGKTRSYDMEGSVVEKYEFSFRHFGGRQQPYFLIWKTNSFLVKLQQLLASSKRRL